MLKIKYNIYRNINNINLRKGNYKYGPNITIIYILVMNIKTIYI